MKLALTLVALSVFAVAAIQPWQARERVTGPGDGRYDALGLPTLYQINTITLSPSYSCRTAGDVQRGYGNTALFLSNFSKTINGPELLFNGACGAADYFVSQTAGDDLDVLTDYGDIPLETLQAQQVFSPARVVGTDSHFTQNVGIVVGHTYGVLINKGYVHGFFYFRVTNHVPNQRVDLQYAVMDYQLNQKFARAPGFSWTESPR